MILILSEAKGEPVEFRDLTAKYTSEVIGLCAFGVHTNSLSEEDSDFRKITKDLYESFGNKLRHLSRTLPHWMAKFLKPLARDDNMINFFVNTLKDTMEYRKKHNIRKYDFVDLLMDVKDNPEQMGEEGMDCIVLF